MAWSNASVSAEEIEAEEGVDASLALRQLGNLFVFLSSPATEHVNLFSGQVPSPSAVINRAKRTVKRDGPFKTRKIGSVNDGRRFVIS